MSARPQVLGRGTLLPQASEDGRQVSTVPAVLPLFSDASAENSPRVALTPAQEGQASERMAILQPLLDYIASPAARERFQQLRLPGGTPIANSNDMAAYLAAQHGVGASTLWNWKRAYEKEGRFGLVRKPNANKHRSAWAAANRDLADVAACVYLGTPDQPGMSKRVAWETVCERARTLKVAAPSYETVRAFLDNPNEVSPSMRVMAREGKRKYEATFAPYIKRGYTEPSNAIWISDHAIVDVYCQNDVWGAMDLAHIRPRMTSIIDHRSRFVVGVAFAEEGSSHAIKRALLRAISRYGLPDVFYADNGKDYRSVARGADRAEIEVERKLRTAELEDLKSGVLKRLGIPVTFCLPYHPQSKHIERYHRTYHERFDKAFRAYTGGAAHLRPDAATAALARHGKLLTMGQAQYSALPLASEYIRMAEGWIDSWYHQQPHDGEGIGGRTPAQCFVEEMPKDARPAPDPATLAMLLAHRVSRKVANCAVQVNNLRLVPNANDQAACYKMHELSGREVVIAYDPLYPHFAAVLDQEMRFVCRLEAEQLYRMSPDSETRAKVGEFIRNRAAFPKAIKQSRKDLQARVAAAGGYTPAEQALRQLAQLPAAVGENVVHRAPGNTVEAADSKQHHSEDIADWFLSQRSHVSGN